MGAGRSQKGENGDEKRGSLLSAPLSFDPSPSLFSSLSPCLTLTHAPSLLLHTLPPQVTRREMLVAFRRNRQHADILRIPARIMLPDGTFDKFVEAFLKIDRTRIGSFTFDELCLHMGISTSEESEEEDHSVFSDDTDLELEASVYASERPESAL